MKDYQYWSKKLEVAEVYTFAIGEKTTAKKIEEMMGYLTKLSMMNVQFCCTILTENITEAGRKGFSVIPFKHENNLYSNERYSFFLQFRDLDFIDNNDCTIAQRAIAYCPWCGADLSKLALRKDRDLAYYSARNSKMII